MKRIATLIAAGALVLAASSTASAQLNVNIGGGRGTGLSFGQPASGYAQPGYNYVQPGYNYAQPGYNYAQPGLVQRGYYGSPYGAYPSAYPGYGINSRTTTYSSGYSGYVTSPNSIIQQRTITTSPYGSGYGYGTTAYPNS